MGEIVDIKSETLRYETLLNDISRLFSQSYSTIIRQIDDGMVATYWSIGKYIVEFEQQGQVRAEYGKSLLLSLSRDLTLRFGKGFSKSNLFNMRLLYVRFPNFQTLSGKLSWSHLIELLGIDSEQERLFYLNEASQSHWSVRTLRSNIDRALFYQLSLGKNKEEIMSLANEGHIVTTPKDAIKNTYYLDFLGIDTQQRVMELDLESAILNHIEEFLLELGKGFAFMGRQYRLTIDNTDYYADLVFYHVILRCYVVIDLKRGKVSHADIGQMNMYLGYFALDKCNEGDNPPIGIVLAADKSDVLVEYATYGMDTQLFVSKYQFYLPQVEELKALVSKAIEK